MKSERPLAIVLAVLCAIGGLMSLSQRPASAQGQGQGAAPVAVVNIPLPVSLQGAGTVTGTVNATQSGNWSVGITGTPTVNIRRAGTPFKRGLCNADNRSCATGRGSFVVPATSNGLTVDQLLVTNISGSCDAQPGDFISDVNVMGSDYDNGYTIVTLVPALQGLLPSHNAYLFGQHVEAAFLAGETVTFHAKEESPSGLFPEAICSAYVVGWLDAH
jgi:hypothetical protein